MSSSQTHGHGPGGGSSGVQLQSLPTSNSTSSSKSKIVDPKKPDPTKDDKDKTPPVWPVLKRSFPYLWPKDSVYLKACFVGSVFCLITGTLGDLYPPIAMRNAVDELSGNVDQHIEPRLPYRWIAVYGIVRFGANFFQQLRDVFFASVSAETERRVALETFNHLQSLSLSFHLRRETGAVLRSVSRGAQSFSTLTRILVFNVAPVFLQLFVVCIYLFTLYQWYFSVLTFVIIGLYFYFTFSTTDWRDKYRRVMNEKDNEFNQKSVDALLNFETVKLDKYTDTREHTELYFNAEKHEEERYDSALRSYTVANTRVQQSLAILNAGQNIIISFGIAFALYLAAEQVLNGEMTVGDWVMVGQFILQLYSPLGFLGTFYRMIKQNLVDVESMFKLLAEGKDISDDPTAKELKITGAEITFDHVSFCYDHRVPILTDITFTVKPGMKVAIVGESGAGKSTIARLVYRFYDVTGGRILVDGQDIRTVTQSSLRREIAIVPQDTVLFNDTIGYNIGYGIYARRPAGATEAEIIAAADRAKLTAFIKKQPHGFDTKVGERGLRLSGGEKQRVAIARALMKGFRILICDEATSALDTKTEIEIQQSLDEVSEGRSSITIAHRLSTIAGSDLIIVLDKGEIVEQGKHAELLAMNGLYHKMWSRQEKAKELKATLDELTKEEEKAKKANLAAATARAAATAGAAADEEKKQPPPPPPPAAAGGVPSGAVIVDIASPSEASDGEERKSKPKSKDELKQPLLG